jgi:hypothetical protein
LIQKAQLGTEPPLLKPHLLHEPAALLVRLDVDGIVVRRERAGMVRTVHIVVGEQQPSADTRIGRSLEVPEVMVASCDYLRPDTGSDQTQDRCNDE